MTTADLEAIRRVIREELERLHRPVTADVEQDNQGDDDDDDDVRELVAQRAASRRRARIGGGRG